MLEVESVTKSFGGIRVLDEVSLSVGAGEVHAITGENGAGKSTLMRIIAGLDSPDTGAVRRSGHVSMIHQELLTFPDMTVSENIWMGQERGAWVRRRAMQEKSRALLERVGVDVDPSVEIRTLSVAQQQSVEIAKAIARRAELIIMDEPTSALSARESDALFAIIAELKRDGTAILYISHRMPEIFRLADRITVLRDGRLVATRDAREWSEASLIASMVGRELPELARRASGARDARRGGEGSSATDERREADRGDAILEVRGLGNASRFRDVSFTLHRGEILGIAGLMGAGRTSVAAAIGGLAPATHGTIHVNGRVVRISSPRDALAHRIAMATEDRRAYGFVPDMSVAENVTLACLARYTNGPFVNARAESAAADEQMRKVNVRATNRDQAVKLLSGGNQQKVVLARALLTDPDILILDEPTRGIDVGAKAEIYALIGNLARAGKAILLVSSEMNEILALSDRVLVMREGAIAGSAGTPEEILKLAMPN